MEDQIARDVVIAAPVERVWDLVTTAEHLGAWFGDDGADIDLRPGGALVLRWKEHSTVHGRVETVEPYSRFSFHWLAGGCDTPAADEPADGTSTLVEFTLVPEGDGTRLTVVESGFSTLALSPAAREERFASHTGGWAFELGELADHGARVAA